MSRAAWKILSVSFNLSFIGEILDNSGNPTEIERLYQQLESQGNDWETYIWRFNAFATALSTNFIQDILVFISLYARKVDFKIVSNTFIWLFIYDLLTIFF